MCNVQCAMCNMQCANPKNPHGAPFPAAFMHISPTNRTPRPLPSHSFDLEMSRRTKNTERGPTHLAPITINAFRRLMSCLVVPRIQFGDRNW